MRLAPGGLAARCILMTSTALAVAGVGWAQEQPPAGDSDGSDKVVIVGSQIVGARPTDALPVTVIGEEELDAIGASSGDELFRSIPQLGDVGFNSASGVNNVGGVNAARGDTASINLRALGTGNTLVLLNGRRMVNHPGTQAENLVPVVTVNANAIPTSGVSRIEVLLDGASALYGADAVAGVLNTVLKDNIEGFLLDLTYGSEDGASADDFAASWELGVKSDDGATRLSLLGSYFTRDPVFAGDRDFSANADLRSRLPADWAANTTVAGQFDNRTATTAWAGFDRFSTGNITVGGVPVTDTFGRFHTQPNTLPGCRVQLGNGVCIDNNLWTLPPADPVSAQFPTGQIADVTNGSTRDGALRYNTNAATTVSNGVDRYNLFAFFNQDLGESLELFAEAGVYLADSVGYREQTAMLAAVPIVIPASNYWNPFGPVGSPNRLANTNAPAQGLDISLTAYRPIDAGPRKTEVENLTTRVLAGLRGDVAGWDWESALLYSQATTEDRENRVSNTLFQQALALATPDAYNPFNGGCVNDVSAGDCTPNPPGVISSFVVPSFRRSGTSLATWDVKVSRPDLFTLWAGDVGAAFGIEARRESFYDDRDPRQDGTILFDDIIGTGPLTNDLQGNNQSLDTRGSRTVQSAYAEIQVPLVSESMGIPLAQTVDMQLAVRHETFDTFGDVTKPKVALSWRPFDFLMFRSAWSEGFRAPNLQQQFESGLQRSNNRFDLIRCEAAVRQGRIASFTTSCPTVPGVQQSVTSSRQGSADLEPEESTNLTYGAVFEATFLPEEWGNLTFTADWWRVEQENVIGIFGDENQILLDYVLRLKGGANPAVVRAAPIADDIAEFAGTRIDPVGEIQFVNDNYLNLDTRQVEGWDFGLYYELDSTPAGDFAFRANAAYLDTFFQDVSANGALINAAAAAGAIPVALEVDGQGELVRDFGRPEWRYSASLTWRLNEFGAGWFTSYVGDVYDDSNLLNGQPWIIEEYQTHNLYVQYELGYDSDAPARFRLGVRNLTDEAPPLADTTFGFLGDLHSAQGRYVYLNVRKTF